jgi:hypothetical protein
MSRTRKRRVPVPWAGWSKKSPSTRQRTKMLRQCKRKNKNKCFLGPKGKFPVCSKNTCKINDKGLYSAYVRARQMVNTKKSHKKNSTALTRRQYSAIAGKAKRMLKKRGVKVGK